MIDCLYNRHSQRRVVGLSNKLHKQKKIISGNSVSLFQIICIQAQLEITSQQSNIAETGPILNLT